MNKLVVTIPFCFIKNNNLGLNLKRKTDIDIYLKILCVSAISVRKHSGPNIDVVVITNFELPDETRNILNSNNIIILFENFDMFIFDSTYFWNLAFYKLDIMYKISHKYNYDYFVYFDSDVFVQNDCSNIFKELEQNILLYDINHGLQVNDYQIFIDEASEYYGYQKLITHYGGEFFGASRENAIKFSEECYKIYKKMISNNIVTTKGDEFILSIAADKFRSIVKNAGAYINRYWTQSFRLVSTNYYNNAVSILHCPSEKEDGFIKLFNKIKNNKPISNEYAHKVLHLKRPRFRSRVRILLDSLKSK